MNFNVEAEKISKELVEIRRRFHENPELDFQLYNTSEFIKSFLENEGIEYITCAETGIVATLYGSHKDKSGKTIAIRTDMDALPILEKNDKPYKSKIVGRMHACGHDAHMTMALGAVKLLNSHRDKLKGNVKFIFEPAEETTGGARVMIKEGVLANPKVDAVIGCHVDESLEAGTVGLKRGTAYAASNPFSITIYGKGTHGASPHKGVDPITITMQVINSLQLLVSREINPANPAVITIGTINGGNASNVIPDSVTITGIIRTMAIEDRAYIVDRVRSLVELQVESLRGRCEIEIMESYPCLNNDDHMCDKFTKFTSELLGSENVKTIKQPTMGVESFSYFSLEVPSVFYHIGCGNRAMGITYPLHSCYFDIDEKCLSVGAAVHANMAMEYLNNI